MSRYDAQVAAQSFAKKFDYTSKPPPKRRVTKHKDIDIPYRVRYERSTLGRYKRQKHNAKARGIVWDFTFEEWVLFWGEQLEDRGQGKLVMCRHNDEGPYHPVNCYIASCASNLKDAAKFRKGDKTDLTEIDNQW